MSMQVEIVVDADLARFLAESGDFEANVAPADAAADVQALEIGLETAAAIVTIATGAVSLASTTASLVKRVKQWLALRKKSSTRVVIRGETDDAAMAIAEDTTTEHVLDAVERHAFNPGA